MNRIESTNPYRRLNLLLLSLAFAASSGGTARAALNIASGLGTTHAGNLVLNGSFELGAPPDGVKPFWANTGNSPYFVPPLWTSNNNSNLAVWGNDGGTPYRLSASDVLPDGRIGVGFHTATGVTVSPAPTFNPNGEVTFASPPAFTSSVGAPVTLRQTVNTQLSPAPSYKMSFWISGEENATVQGFNGVGIIGMQLSNVLPGDPVQWLVAPNGLSYGQSKLYEYTFTPLNTSLPVDLRFINWGGMDLTAYGGSQFGTQPILDDVIINGVPEPSSVMLLGLGMAAMIAGVRRKRRGAARD